MSSKPKGKKPEAVMDAPMRPSGRAPGAMVETRHGTDMMSRPGRGFSMGELSGAGFSPNTAMDWGVSVDVRRRSVLQGNVDALKGWGVKQAPSKKSERRVKKVEEEIETVVEEVKEEAEVIEEEVEKVGKKVKKEASKAEKAVKAKVEKPRARPKKKAEA